MQRERARRAPRWRRGASHFHFGLPAFATSSLMALIATCICWWPNTTAPSITSSERPFASDSTISTAASVPATTRCSCDSVSCFAVGIQQVLAVLPADARGADGAVERQARERQRGGGAEQRGNVRIDIRIERQDGRDDLHVVVEAIREQRTHRPIDEARGERLLFGGPPFTLEEAPGNAARGVRLLDVVDRQRKEIAARARPAWRRTR